MDANAEDLISIKASDLARLIQDASKKKGENEIISANETADMIGVTRRTLHNYSKKGKLVPIYPVGRVRYRLSDVQNFLTERNKS